ncbi:uncharacterized protein PV09_07404 [Verruconis gallopava]|uniref:Major facilitator superfamily (MFS) profile domain-containing protein n=1 Tax=Verruconis gallopava TaxID=253628 RepID=A0A0D1XFZ6_9PEZI|nr:uncharacterized protein PV09_07404 [Verruconis gallopava]KIW01116.1 hypothetical protein PV09_07404 [Verruconis gallopava]
MTAFDHMDQEETPLLRSPRVPKVSDEFNTPKGGRRSEKTIVAMLFLAIITVCTGEELIQSAKTRVLESIICRRYYTVHDPSLIGSDGGDGVAERHCKNHVVQGDVAMLKGWLTTIESCVVLLVGVPWGYAADLWGRKPILIIWITGVALRAAWIQLVCFFWQTFPIQAIWGAAAFALIGGGHAMTSALLFTLVTDVIPEERRASRFFQISGSANVTKVVVPLISAELMKVSPWLPMLLGLALLLLAVPQALILPETKDYLTEAVPTTSGSVSETSSTCCSSSLASWSQIKRAGEDVVAFLAADTRLLLLVPAFLMHMLVMNKDITLQYISTRYSLTLADATFILTLRSGLVLSLMLVLYPALSHFLRIRLGMHSQRIDLLMARCCVVSAGFGFFMIAFAYSLPMLLSSMVVNTLGSGLHLYLRSVATSLVELHQMARLMTFMSWIDTIGLMIASPFIAWLFERGIEVGGLLTGLPFLFCSAMYTIIAILIAMVSPKCQ